MGEYWIETGVLIVGKGEPRDLDGRLHLHPHRGLQRSDVANVANLAMLFVGGMAMPVGSPLHGKKAHREDQGHRQQPYGYSLRDHRTKTLPQTS
jgi:hypothetical protein